MSEQMYHAHKRFQEYEREIAALEDTLTHYKGAMAMANLKRAEMEKAFKAADEIADAEAAERLRLEKLVAQLEKKIERRDRMIDYYMRRVDGLLDPGHPDDLD